MAKINQVLTAKLIFERSESIITIPDGVYRQCSYIHCPSDLTEMPHDSTRLDEEAKNFLTYSIDMELSKKYVRCRSCWQHIIQHFEKSCTHKCGNCGEINEIKVLIEKQ